MTAARPNPRALGYQDPVAALLERTTRNSNVPMIATDAATLARVAAVVRAGSSDAQ